MRFHWQDLNDDSIKRYWKHGRCWWGSWSLEWVIPSWGAHWGVSVAINAGDSNDQWTFHLGLGFFAIFLGVKVYRFHVGSWSVYAKKPFFMYGQREFSLNFHGGAMWINVWYDWLGSSGSSCPWYQNGFHFDPMNFFFGRTDYSERILKEGDCFIPMPEGSYDATYKHTVATWKRPRWPFKEEHLRVHIDIPKGIPVEGKGENSYDCGEDATYGMTCHARTVADGIGKIVASVLHDRVRYGGSFIHRELHAVKAKVKEVKNESLNHDTGSHSIN